MAKITGLDSRIDPIDAEEKAEMPTLRKILQLVVSQSKTRTADDARRVARVVPKIRGGADADLTDEEFKVLKELAEGNQANLSAYVQGYLLDKIDPQKA